MSDIDQIKHEVIVMIRPVQKSLAAGSGFVLPVVLILSMVMGVAIFSYHRIAMQQNILAHHVLLGEVAGRLALTSARVIADQFQSSGKSFFTPNLVPALFEPLHDNDAEITLDNDLLEPLKADINAYLAQMTHLRSTWEAPYCSSLTVTLKHLKTIPGSIGRGFDPVEKSGELVISCSVVYEKLARRASIVRLFRVVSFNPGPYARFSLFVPFTPSMYSYNALGLNYTGELQPNFKWPIPEKRQYSSPLCVINGGSFPEQNQPVVVPDAAKDIQNRGWVFLGPWLDGTNKAPVCLRLGSGYDTPGGCNFMLSMPVENPITKKLALPSETIILPDIKTTGQDFSVSISGVFQGFYTLGQDAKGVYFPLGVLSDNQWPHLGKTDKDLINCSSTWLFPFGDRLRPSRTLMLGKVLVSFLKSYIVNGKGTHQGKPPGSVDNLSGRLKPKTPPFSGMERQYGPRDPITLRNTVADQAFSQHEQMFKGANSGFESYLKVSPVDFSPHMDPVTPFPGLAWNCLFDTMSYPGISLDSWAFPQFGSDNYEPVISQGVLPDRLPKRYFPGKSPIPKGLFATNISLNIPAGSKIVSNYEGDVAAFDPTAILNRVTHVLDFSSCSDQKQENQKLAELLFNHPGDDTDLSFNRGVGSEDYFTQAFFNQIPGQKDKWHVPKMPGIFYINRRNTLMGKSPHVPAVTDQALSLPGPILLQNHLIIIVDRGDIIIPGPIISPRDPNGFPKFQMTIIALEGNIQLDTRDEIDAYLVALFPGTGATAQGGRLLSGPAGVTKMNVFGGVAVWEMGLYDTEVRPTTMSAFPDGGLIRYNIRFNHDQGELYKESRQLVVSDFDQSVIITGDK
ncbi:MAG: hypothetical protein HQM10_26065 [Candidatus Riflebacteria bacterium]|nr:hypothetical protein [Candidatus Riflebacteria bacterium]